MKFFLPIILLAVSATGFFLLVKPYYQETAELRTKARSYDEALGNSKTLEGERDKLVKKYNAISPDDLAKLEKLLPDNLDNIRLILEIEKIANNYGISLRNVKYNTEEEKTEQNKNQNSGARKSTAVSDYGEWNLEFTASGNYQSFISFAREIEKNLRIVDIASLEFSSAGASVAGVQESYTYNFKIKTYWLK